MSEIAAAILLASNAIVFATALLALLQSKKNTVLAEENKIQIFKTHDLVNSRLDEFKEEQRKLLVLKVAEAMALGRAEGKAEGRASLTDDAGQGSR